jgi:hypothetical protein
VTEASEGLEVPARPAAEIEDGAGCRRLHVAQQCGNVLADVMIARALTEVFGPLVIVRQGLR